MSMLNKDEMEVVKRQIEYYKKSRDLHQFGEYYRLTSPFEHNVCAWMVISPDRRCAILTAVRALNHPEWPEDWIKLCGLNPEMEYVIDGETHYGDELMKCGWNVKFGDGDFAAVVVEIWAQSQILWDDGFRT